MFYNLYGAHGNLDNPEAKKMNKVPKTAAAWKGKVLLYISSFNEKKPALRSSTEMPENLQD